MKRDTIHINKQVKESIQDDVDSLIVDVFAEAIKSYRKQQLYQHGVKKEK
jgi:hypothetical protein